MKILLLLMFIFNSFSCGKEDEANKEKVVYPGTKNDPNSGKTDQNPKKSDKKPEENPKEKPKEPENPYPNFLPEPYGHKIKDRVGDFSFNTLRGNFNFKKSWTTKEVYFFVVAYNKVQYSMDLFNSNLAALFVNSPKNIRIFFISLNDDPKKEMETRKVQMESNLKKYIPKEADYWKERVHFVVDKGLEIKGFPSEAIKNLNLVTFVIDRLQQNRQPGTLSIPFIESKASLKNLKQEAEFFNFEWQRHQKYKNGYKIVKLLEKAELNGKGKSFEISLPETNELLNFDTLLVDLDLSCPDHLDKNCPEWDVTSGLSICLKNPEEKCYEIARWITPYHREGRWITDISPMLAFMTEGGKTKFSFSPGNGKIASLSFLLKDSNKGMRPKSFKKLFSGGTYNLDYNKKYKPLEFDYSSQHKRIDLYALITGHGFGYDADNCAEFCNHTHHFGINDNKYFYDNPYAKDRLGCLKQVNKGTVPNQYGTWNLGRAGWCPGLDVFPIHQDLAKSLKKGKNEVTYKSLFKGSDYRPRVLPDKRKNGFPGNINLASYLIFWE